MTLILLAISLTIAFCVLAYNLAIYALPFAAGLTAFQYAYAADASSLISGLAAISAALGSIALVIAVVGFAKNPALRLVALAIFAIPAVIAAVAVAMINHSRSASAHREDVSADIPDPVPVRAGMARK